MGDWLQQVKQAGRRLTLWKLAVRPQFPGSGLWAWWYFLVTHWWDNLELRAGDMEACLHASMEELGGEELGMGDDNGKQCKDWRTQWPPTHWREDKSFSCIGRGQGWNYREGRTRTKGDSEKVLLNSNIYPFIHSALGQHHMQGS